MDEFWYEQSHRLHYFGNSTQACQQQYVTELAQMHQSLPLLLELSMEARAICSMPVLDELDFHAGVALSIELLLWQHQPSPVVKQLLLQAMQQGRNEPVAALLWSTAVAAVQVNHLTGGCQSLLSTRQLLPVTDSHLCFCMLLVHVPLLCHCMHPHGV